jgi:hypothetical protein
MGNAKNQQFINTAKIITVFIKDHKVNSNYKEEIDKTFMILEDDMKKMTFNDYERSIMAYNYALYGNSNTSKIHINKINCNFLEQKKSFIKHKSMFIEIASYLILTKVLINEDPQNEVKWLLSQRSPDGRFYSPHDTVLALRALLEFSKYAATSGLNLDIEGVQTKKFACNIQTAEYSALHGHEPESLQKQSYRFSYSIDYEKSDLANGAAFFNTTKKLKKINETLIEINLDFKFNGLENTPETNLVIVEVRLPTGYKFIKLNSVHNIMKSESKEDGNLVILYIDKMAKNKPSSCKLTAKKNFDMESCGQPYVRIYDYYQPNLYQITYYDDISPNDD